MPICLPMGADFPDLDVGLAGYVAGWGHVKNPGKVPGPTNPDLTSFRESASRVSPGRLPKFNSIQINIHNRKVGRKKIVGPHSTEEAFALPTQPSRVQFSGFPIFFKYDVA